jgi:uncharacterized protein with PIN domain
MSGPEFNPADERQPTKEEWVEFELNQMKERLVKLFGLIAEEKRPCRACAQELWFVRHKNGKVAPYTADGTNHFINCPHAKEFKRK